MTGFGGFSPPSQDTGALKAISSKDYAFANKDFVKNIAYLNQATDSLAAWAQTAQSGIDAAGANPIEQIQGIFADLFVIFAGGEPTGIELGDIKYIFSALGSLLGVNPDTPFPLNLLEAATHLFTQFLVPLPQFSDLIFDAMAAWAEDLGFSDAAVDSIQEFNTAVIKWYNDFSDVLDLMFGWLKSFLKIFGLGSGGGALGPLGSLFNEIGGLINAIIAGPKQMLLAILSQLVVMLFKSMTFLVNLLNPMNLLEAIGFKQIGPQLAPDISSSTSTWTFGTNPNTDFVFDSTVSSGGSPGSFKTNGSGIKKRILNKTIQACVPGDEYTLSGMVLWSGIPTDHTTYGPCVVFYNGNTEVSQVNANAAASHGASGGWKLHTTDVIVPDGVNGFKIGARCNAEINTGLIRVDQLSFTKYDVGCGIGSIGGFFSNLLNPFSLLNAGNLFGWISPGLFGSVPIGAITNDTPNLLTNPLFDNGSLAECEDWIWDDSTSASPDGTGSIKINCDGEYHALRSGKAKEDIIPVTAGQTLTLSVNAIHHGFIGTSTFVGDEPIRLQVVPFKGSVAQEIQNISGFVPPAEQDSEWPGHVLSGNYAVPTGITGIQVRLLVTSSAKAGAIHFDNANVTQTGKIKQEWVDGLDLSLNGIIGRIGAVVDVVFNAFTGQTSILTSLEQLAAALIAIPFGNILGVGGAGNIGSSILDLILNIIGGLVGVAPDPDDPDNTKPPSLADLFNLMFQVASSSALGRFAFELLGIRNNTPVSTGLMPNSKSNFPINDINVTLNATKTASLIATYRIGESSPLGVVSWLGYGTTNLDAFYINIWKIDNTTGAWSLAHHSPDILGNIVASTTTPGWNFYNLATPLAVVAGEQYAFEIAPVGTGTHYVRGISTADTIPDHPYAAIVGLAYTRDNSSSPNSPPSSYAKLEVPRSGNIPWVEVAIDTGNTPGYYDPITVYLTESGTVPIPDWAGFIDCIVVGGGGGGHKSLLARTGEGGYAGKFAAITWQRDVHFNSSVHNVTFTRGNGGTAGTSIFGGVGGVGGSSTLSITGHTITASGGAGGTGLYILGGRQWGEGPKTFTWNDQPYVGGGHQNVAGSNGISPGGGGAGGAVLILGDGGAGAPGGGWVRFRQGAITGGGDTLDTTPPTKPTTVLGGRTYSTITVSAIGSTDT